MQSVRAQGLTSAVQYLGPIRLEDIVGAIEDCDVGVIPNQRSVFTEINTPTRIFEYLAVGKPVIAPRAGGIRDYFDEESLIFFASSMPFRSGITTSESRMSGQPDCAIQAIASRAL